MYFILSQEIGWSIYSAMTNLCKYYKRMCFQITVQHNPAITIKIYDIHLSLHYCDMFWTKNYHLKDNSRMWTIKKHCLCVFWRNRSHNDNYIVTKFSGDTQNHKNRERRQCCGNGHMNYFESMSSKIILHLNQYNII